MFLNRSSALFHGKRGSPLWRRMIENYEANGGPVFECWFAACLLVCLLGPVFEHFDRWDNFPQSGQDIILTLVACCIAFALLLICTPGASDSSQPSSHAFR